METHELQIRERELALKKRKQNLSAGKFVVGAVLLGGLSLILDIESILYTQSKDDRDFLSRHLLLLQESDLQKRLINIELLGGISGGKLEYLELLMHQTLAEVVEEKKRRIELNSTEKREKTEREDAAEDEINRAREAERLAGEAAVEAKRRTEDLRSQVRKAYDRALQEAYPHESLFDLKRRGVKIP